MWTVFIFSMTVSSWRSVNTLRWWEWGTMERKGEEEWVVITKPEIMFPILDAFMVMWSVSLGPQFLCPLGLSVCLCRTLWKLNLKLCSQLLYTWSSLNRPLPVMSWRWPQLDFEIKCSHHLLGNKAWLEVLYLGISRHTLPLEERLALSPSMPVAQWGMGAKKCLCSDLHAASGTFTW